MAGRSISLENMNDVVSKGNSSNGGSKNVIDNSANAMFNAIRVDNRLKKRVRKRLSKSLSLEDNGSGSMIKLGHSLLRYSKNSRRSRNGFGRGLPKRGGDGGKGTWGKLGSELMFGLDDMVADAKDPNFDPENDGNCEFEAITPEMTLEELSDLLNPAILEYFEHGDSNEVIMFLHELNLGQLKPQIIKLIVSFAMDRKPSHREITSVLISDLYVLIDQENMKAGFDLLLKDMPDLVIDIPDASTVLGNFIARAIADDCMPPKFIHSYKGQVECVHARAALEHADALLNMKHGLVRLDNVWGVGGGMRPVQYLIKQMVLLLNEYICSGDIEEACRCINELEVPHFHHQLIYEGILIVIEDMTEKTMILMCKLFQVLASTVIVWPDQMSKGFLQIYKEMQEICIDVPHAYIVLEKFVMKCQAAKLLPLDVIKRMPTRGRKRFVSEGDGGAVKPH